MMHGLFLQDAQMIVQGMTGKEGARMTRWLLADGIRVVAGVTPGKSGQNVEDCPIFDSVQAACERFPSVTVSSIVVPAPHVFSAAKEALEAGIRHVHILTEQVPVQDVAQLLRLADQYHAMILGPSSVGYVQFPFFRMGYLGGEKPLEQLKEGGVAVISTSGGMTNELMAGLSRRDIGIRLGCALGGDRLVGWSIEKAVRACEALNEVDLLALFVEPGRAFLRAVSRGEFQFQKPVVMFLAGEALDDMPRGLAYGHAGTILSEGEMSVRAMRERIRAKDIACVGTMSEFLQACEQLCQKK